MRQLQPRHTTPPFTSPGRRARSLAQRALVAPVLSLLLLAAGCNGDGSDSGSGNPTGLPTGSFDIGVSAAVAVRRENSTIVDVNVTRSGGYVAPVFVTLTGLPSGVTGPSVSSTSTNQVRLTLVADGQATLGATTVTVTAQGSDVPNVVKTFVLTVSQ